jgi:hypoxanthine-DNA glycosylase
MSETTGFPPIAAPDARVLILGSLPSVKSVEIQQYYGHPQNSFWRVMDELFEVGIELPYSDRVARLLRNHVAVWDVLAASVRPGSLDAAIVESTARANNFRAFFREQTELRLVCFNGKAATKLFERLVAPSLEKGSNTLEFKTLPSTSPAHASMTFADKLECWRVLLDAVDNT